jgi:hypothetical protein
MENGLSLTNQKANKEQLTPSVWNHSTIPEGENRIDIDVRLILDKRYYERFMYLIHNDPQLFSEICSTMLNSNLENWAGEMWTVGNPEVVCDFIAAAHDKHMPLPHAVTKED